MFLLMRMCYSLVDRDCSGNIIGFATLGSRPSFFEKGHLPSCERSLSPRQPLSGSSAGENALLAINLRDLSIAEEKVRKGI